MKVKEKRLFVRIDANLLERIDRQAKLAHRTRSDYIRIILELSVEASEQAEKNFEKEGE